VTNEDVMTNMNGVLRLISEALAAILIVGPTPTPPLKGRGSTPSAVRRRK
jgi:hypothetical protein